MREGYLSHRCNIQASSLESYGEVVASSHPSASIKGTLGLPQNSGCIFVFNTSFQGTRMVFATNAMDHFSKKISHLS